MSRLNEFLQARATRKNILIWLVLTVVLISSFSHVITPMFREATAGLEPIDLQFPITPERIYDQLPSYTERSVRLYIWFAVVDWLFPLAAAMFLALLWAWLLARGHNRVFATLKRWGLLALPFVAALLDWVENVGFLTLVLSYPVEMPGVAAISCVVRQVKLMVLSLNSGVTVCLIAVALVATWARRGQRGP